MTVNDLRLRSLYIPNGRALDDPHYAYKLDWLAALTSHARKELSQHPERALALMGDWNVAPRGTDMGDPSFILGSSAFADLVTDASIHRNERKGDAPSDHVPVVVDLSIDSEFCNDDDRPMIFG